MVEEPYVKACGQRAARLGATTYEPIENLRGQCPMLRGSLVKVYLGLVSGPLVVPDTISQHNLRVKWCQITG